MLSGNVGNKKARGRNREPFPKWGGEGGASETRALFVSRWDSFPKRSLTGFVAEMLPSSKHFYPHAKNAQVWSKYEGISKCS